MVSSASNPEDYYQQPDYQPPEGESLDEQSAQPDGAADSAADDAPPESSLLDEVLEQTLAAAESGQHAAQEELQPLLDVAERYRGQPFALDPVGVDLVHAALRGYFQHADVPSDEWPDKLRHISARVATTIFDDPVAHDRLEVFWNRLSAIQ